MTTEPINIIPVLALKDNYIWLIAHPERQQAIIVDPGEAQPVLAALQKYQLQLAGILITHHHFDHCGAVGELLRHHNVRVFASAAETIAGVTDRVSENDSVDFPSLGLHFQVLSIPAHTRGHIAYYGHNSVFCGDTLFTGGCGRLFEGTAEQMYASLQKLAALPDETLVYCGHEYTAANLRFALAVEPHNPVLLTRINDTQTLRQQGLATVPATLCLEKQTNPFLRCHIPEVIAAATQYAGAPLTTPVDVFRTLRAWKDGFSQ